MAPNMYLYQRAYDRAEQAAAGRCPTRSTCSPSRSSPASGSTRPLSQVARNTEGPLADEFARMLQEMQIGRSRTDALRSLADRTNLPDLRAFVSAMVQADAFGIPIGQVLRVQSSEIRVKRRQWAEESRAEGAGEDPGPADLLHPSLPVHRGPRAGRHQYLQLFKGNVTWVPTDGKARHRG